MSLESEITKLITDFGQKLSDDLNESLNSALRDGGSKNTQEAALHFNPTFQITTSGTTIRINASSSYWFYVENGRRPGKMPPSNKLGKKWQNKNNIDARKIIQEIQINYYKKKGFNYNVKPLPFDKAAKQLGYLIARSIGKHGYEPRPFIKRVINDGRITALSNALSLIFKKEIKITTI